LVLLWISVGVTFGIYIMYRFGADVSTLYFAAYVLESSLSIDNLLVFAVIFSYFLVPTSAQRIVLYVGILSAIVLRAAFIYGGVWLLETYRWTIIIFGVVLFYSGLKVWNGAAEAVKIENNRVVKWTRRFLPIANEYQGTKFIIRSGKLMFTPLIIVLLTIETSDIMFAFDSIPAAIALTQNFFIAFTSNISAVLGLRSLYFLIALTMFKFKYIGKGLGLILGFLGVKFIISLLGIEIPLIASIAVIFGILGVAILASILSNEDKSHGS
jgi:tellurite resistance protein TerC